LSELGNHNLWSWTFSCHGHIGVSRNFPMRILTRASSTSLCFGTFFSRGWPRVSPFRPIARLTLPFGNIAGPNPTLPGLTSSPFDKPLIVRPLKLHAGETSSPGKAGAYAATTTADNCFFHTRRWLFPLPKALGNEADGVQPLLGANTCGGPFHRLQKITAAPTLKLVVWPPFCRNKALGTSYNPFAGLHGREKFPPLGNRPGG